MEASVAEVTEQHFVLVLGLITLHTLLAVRALPLVAGDELRKKQLIVASAQRPDIHVDEVEAEADAGWVRGLVALAAVEQHLWHAQLVLVHVSCSEHRLSSAHIQPLSYLHNVCM